MRWMYVVVAATCASLAAIGRASAQDLPFATGSITTGGIVTRIVVKPGHDERKRDLAGYSLILYRANHDSTVLTTDAAGRITMIVPAGEYHLVSVTPLIFDGVPNVWNVPLRVYGGMSTVELTAANAQVAATPNFARATPVFSPASPTVQNPLTGATEQSAAGAGAPSLVVQPGICCMKDPAAAVMFSVIFPGGGQFYNGSTGKGILFFVLEVGGAYALESGASASKDCNDGFGMNCGSQQTIEYAGLGILVTSWVVSLIDASAGAHRHNRNLGRERRVALSIAPGGSGRTDFGLRVALP